LALKISFANAIAKLSDKVGADVVEVMDAVGEDRRIGRAFLNAGRGYGGGCFPKDVSGLIASIREHGADPEIFDAIQDLNNSMPGYIVTKLKSEVGELTNKKIAVLGLAFKAGTSDVRRSGAVAIANILSQEGAEVTAYDPEANEEAAPDLEKFVVLEDSIDAAAAHAEIIVIATEWPAFKNLDLKKYKHAIIVDAMNVLDATTVRKAGVQYIGVGRNFS